VFYIYTYMIEQLANVDPEGRTQEQLTEALKEAGWYILDGD
jgi:uncharacterized protein Smg (DUF494 family)